MASTSTLAHQSEFQTTFVFDEIAPLSSSGSTSKNLPCSVFINHRGPDVKQSLARAIYDALYVWGIGVFLDSWELQLGDNIPAAIEEAMKNAALHIAIFSPRYAQSAWCLAELAFMLKTHKLIIPVFYGVKPADLRWVEKGVYAEAFAKHQENGRYSPQKLEEWKKALHDVSYSNGEIIRSNDEDEERQKVKKIVNRALKETKVSLSAAKYPVGLEDSMVSFEKFVQESEYLGHPKVHMIGIWGMGGVGKTTLAKELYNRKHSNVEYSSFLFGIREAAAENKLHKRQRRLLEDLGILNLPYFDNIEDGKKILSNYLRSVRVLIVLDDVDCPRQLDALLPMKDSLALGSLILVTTREREVLQSWSITSIYKMEPLNPFYAKQLFCWHALLRPSPSLGFEELVTKFTDACNGLPLSLKVIGSMLYCYSPTKELWEDVWHKISKILPGDIKNCLRVSYDGLDADEKQIFLDAACFFIGEDYRKAIAVWEGSDWRGLYGIERLISKCLVDLDDKNCIKMHDHLRDLGREVATTQSPYRLLTPNQITAIQRKDQEKFQIRGMILNTGDKGVNKFPSSLLNTRRPLPGFLSSTRISFPFEPQVFVFEGNDRDKLPIAGSSTELVWLSCTGIADRNLPLTMENLRVLELHQCRKLVRLWRDGPGVPLQLRMLTIDGCRELQIIPKSIGLLKNLKQISLRWNNTLKGLPEEFCCLESLEHLQLNSCYNLKSLPSCFGELGNLRHLDLASCSRLVLQPDIMQNMTRLEYLNITNCGKLKELPTHITNQIGLKELYAEHICLRRLPIDIGKLSNLRVMKIGSQALAESFGGLHHLEHLEITSLEVESLPQSFKQLNNLQTLEIKKSRIRILDFGRGEYTSSLCKLEKITLRETEVYKISISEDCCPCLKSFKVLQSACLREAEILPITVEKIQMTSCPELIVFLCSAKLASLDLCSLDKIEKIEKLQECASLEYISIMGCPQLNALPNFGKLVSLQKIVLKGLKKIERIDGLQHCTSLEYIGIRCCPQLNVLPSFEKLGSLNTLELVGLHKIKKIDGLQYCTSLNNFELTGVRKIEKLEGLQNCTSLTSITIKDCPQLSVLVCFEKLASLREFRVEKCKKVVKLEGLQHCSALGRLKVENTCLGMPSTESLGQMKLLEPCIPKIQKQKRPAEMKMIICTRAMHGTGSVLIPSDFPSLSVLRSFENKKINIWSSRKAWLILKGRGECSTNWNAAMLYLVINCVSPRMGLCIEGDGYWSRLADIEDDGRSILIGLCSPVMSKDKIYMWDDSSTNCNKVEKGLVLMGDQNDVREAFWRMVSRLQH